MCVVVETQTHFRVVINYGNVAAQDIEKLEEKKRSNLPVNLVSHESKIGIFTPRENN